jgi:hypothetical protein
MSLLYTEHPGVWGPHEHQYDTLPLKGPVSLTRARPHGLLDAHGLQSPAQHVRMAKFARHRCLGPSMARAQCNEGSMERQPFSDITARLLHLRIQARETC